MKRIFLPIAVITMLLVAVSCNPSKKYEEDERSQIESFIASHNITAEPDANGLYFIEITPGTGEKIATGDSLAVYYVGKFLDGTEFDGNTGEDTPFRFRLGSVGLIEGWNIGLKYMKSGTKAQLVIPSKLGYGTMGYGYYDYYGRYITIIPGYTPLFFEIEVVDLVKAGK
ncbi:MAG TPA: FKBP-type peptidyl-prolyl cis-trans isomerase [Bacteroidales bacterium]|nr:FKBP-type peptidyl-prolyl cis-trans isomerase [Bacteroidales bacterium]